MKVIHPDVLLRSLTRSQFLGWMVWAGLRGPVGPARQDEYVRYLAQHADPAVLQPEFRFSWAIPAEENPV